MTVDNWSLAVGREMRADMWYENVEPDDKFQPDDSEVNDQSVLRRNGTVPKALAAVSGTV